MMQSQLVYTADGITEDAQQVCKLLKIDPSTLMPRGMDSFKEKGASEMVVQIRYQHYEEKRKGKVALIEQTIKNGMGSPPDSPVKNGNESMTIHRMYDGVTNLSKSMPPAFGNRPDIPLRDPIDPEQKIERKIAKEKYR